MFKVCGIIRISKSSFSIFPVLKRLRYLVYLEARLCIKRFALTVEAPIKNAHTSVTDVTNIETP